MERVETVDDENYKEMAGNADKVAEEISKNSHLIVDRGALLHKVFWFGKTFGDIIIVYWFYVKTSFAVCTVGFDRCEKSSRKIMNLQEEFRNSNQVQILLSKKK